jgi:hypothetical protein
VGENGVGVVREGLNRPAEAKLDVFAQWSRSNPSNPAQALALPHIVGCQKHRFFPTVLFLKMFKHEHELERAATKFLRAHGFTAAGRPKKAISAEQVIFERRIIATPAGGQPGYRRGKRR